MFRWRGRQRWCVEVEVFSPDELLAIVWSELPDALRWRDRRMVEGWGFQDEDEGLYARATLLVGARNESAARDAAGRMVDRVIAAAPASVRSHPGMTRCVAISAAEDNEIGDRDAMAQAPDDPNGELRAAAWHRFESGGNDKVLKIAWFTGGCPLERVDVEEHPERVTVTLHERYPPAFDRDGVAIGIPAVGMIKCVEVGLDWPLAQRPVFDGATGRQPADIKPGQYGERGARREVLAVDLDELTCQPRPSGEPTRRWDDR